MADGFVRVAADGTGKHIDNTEITSGATTENVYRQRVVITGDAAAASIVDPSATAPSTGVYAIPVRLAMNSTDNVIGSVHVPNTVAITVATSSSNGTIPVFRPAQVRAQTISTGATLSSTAETAIVAAGGASIYRDITHLTITNESTSAPVDVVIRSSSGSATTYSFYIAERGGMDANYSPPWPQATANSQWTATLQTSATVNIHVVAVAVTS